MRFTAGLQKGYVISSLAVLLTACGGGGVNGVSITGRVIDGYINGAVVCLDVNDNKVCDSNEPTATSGAGGAFTLNPPSTLDLSSVRLIANVPSTAIDEDTGAAVGTAYQMTAPANIAVVTPLTTLALSYKDQGQTWANSMQSVKNNLGITDAQFKIDSDYVAEANIKTHNVARLVAGVLQSNEVSGSVNVRSIVAGLSSFAITAFNSSNALASTELSTLVIDGAYATKSRIFASIYTRSAGWVDLYQVYKEGDTDTNGFFGRGVHPYAEIWGETWPEDGNVVAQDGSNFFWGTWSSLLASREYIESWVMQPTGFNITNMSKMNIKIWGNPDISGQPRFTPVLESQTLFDNCRPVAQLNTPLVAAQIIYGNPTDQANYTLDLNSFSITESCNGAVNTMTQFIQEPLKTVRIRINQANTAAVAGINVGAITFAP
ncbi:hypothetical protein ACHEXL_13535 [Limnohabitans sp. yimb22184]|uniref:hypothetical protein n=1 Tax=Limnohabitans sp. YIMB22184 TaxID=3374104 RepID=UPI003A8C1811